MIKMDNKDVKEQEPPLDDAPYLLEFMTEYTVEFLELFFRGGTPAYENGAKMIKQAAVSAWRLLQYFQLPDKILPILQAMFIMFAAFQKRCVFIPILLSETHTVFCETLRFRRNSVSKTLHYANRENRLNFNGNIIFFFNFRP
jgi:hypothetical protein